MPEFQEDRDIVMAAVKSDYRAVDFIPEKFKDDHEIILEGCKQSIEALRGASRKLRNDMQFMAMAYEIDQNALNYAPKGFAEEVFLEKFYKGSKVEETKGQEKKDENIKESTKNEVRNKEKLPNTRKRVRTKGQER